MIDYVTLNLSFTGTCQETLKKVTCVEEQLTNLQKYVDRLKVVFIGHLPEEGRNQVFQHVLHEAPDTLKEFTDHISEHGAYKELVVCI